MEIMIKCNQSEEEAVAYEAISKLFPNLKDIIYENIEIRSQNSKFIKNNEEVHIYMDSDISRMAIRKLSAVGSVMQILWHIMNDSLADLIDKMGEFDVLINGELLESDEYEDEIPEDLKSLFRDKNNLPFVSFPEI